MGRMAIALRRLCDLGFGVVCCRKLLKGIQGQKGGLDNFLTKACLLS